MRYGTWNVRSLHKLRSLTTVARELPRNRLDLVGVQEVSWDKEGKVRPGSLYSSMEKQTKIINWKHDFFYTTEYYQQLRE